MRDIQHHLASTLSAGAQRGDHFEDHRRGSRCCPACGSTRPLEESSSRWSTAGAIRADGPRLFTGSPPARPISRSGRGMDGCQARGLSIWAPGRGRSLLEGRLVCAELANRGVKDVPIVEGAPPARERSARGNATGSPAFPRRSRRPGPRPRSPPAWSTRFRAPGCGSSPTGTAGRSRPLSRPICTAPNQEAAWQALTDFSESDMGVKYPQTVATWERAWERFIPFLDFPPMLRRVISPPLRGRYPLHQHDRDCELPATQGSPMNRGHFPSDEAVIKLLWLAICDTCGQTSPRTRQGERTASIQAQGQGQTRRRTDHHRPDTRPWPSSPPPTPTESTPTCKTLTQKTGQARSVCTTRWSPWG